MLSWQVLLLASILLAAVIALLLLAREVQEQRRKDEQMRALLEQQRALFRVSTAVHSGRDWHDLLKAIVDAGMEAVQARAGALLFVDEKNRCLTFATAKTDNGYRVRKSTLAWGEGIAGRVAEERKVVILPEADDPLVFELPESLHPRTVVAVPLIGEQRTMGVLELISERRGNTFTEADREMLLTLGTQSATALENARLRENLAQHVHLLRRSIQELSALVDVSKALTALDVHQVLDKILTKALQMMQAEKGSLMLLDETEQVLRIEVARGLSEEIIRTARVKLGEGIAGRVALEGKPLRLLDQVNGERFRGHAVRHDVRDALCVPLWVQDKVIGVLNLNNKKGPEVFSEHDLELLTALANQAAISIHNARLFGDLQDLFLSTVRSLASAVDARDPYTAGHQERVTKYALVIADQLGRSPEEKETL
ncbi:MAG TPA: GAF domain-containing protein, partial [Armatimonadetes bacterium]|nr:GAF domain-containing protein [Armatimonadota bacterium]